MSRWIVGIVGAALLAASAAAHHGWASYDEKRPVKIEGPVLILKYVNPHAEIVMEVEGKKWDAVLAPISRMEKRGLKREDIAVGKRVIVEGYPRKDGIAEIRAERLTANGRTIELR